MKIFNGQEAFAELSAGRIIEARHKDALEFDSLDNFPATIMVNPEYEFRIALTFITIGEMQVPEPLKEAPAKGTQCFAPSLLTEELSKSFKWKNSDLDLALLQRGQVHLEQEHAVIHAQALIVIGGGTTQPAVEAQVQDEIESITQAESDSVDEVLDEADPAIQKFIDAIDKCSSDYDLQGVERNLDGNQHKLCNVEYEQLKQRIAEKRESFFEAKQPVITAQPEPVENEITETEQPSLIDLIDDQAKSAVQDTMYKDAMSGSGQSSYPINMLYNQKKKMLISKIQEMDSIEALERLAPAIPAAKLNPEDHQELLRIYAERKTAMQHADA